MGKNKAPGVYAGALWLLTVDNLRCAFRVVVDILTSIVFYNNEPISVLENEHGYHNGQWAFSCASRYY